MLARDGNRAPLSATTQRPTHLPPHSLITLPLPSRPPVSCSQEQLHCQPDQYCLQLMIRMAAQVGFNVGQRLQSGGIKVDTTNL